MAKINIFSGFLGAGKTTLIKKLLKESFKDKVVLIENEFGEISVDGGFMKEAGIEIRELNSGCICCSLVGDFEESLRQVIETYHPERVIIEPSGVGKLSDVKNAVGNVRGDDLVMDGSIAVVHAKKCKMYAANFGEFFTDQIAHAECIVLSRTQDVSEKKLAETIEIIRKYNEKAPIVTTPWDDIEGDQILAAMHHSELMTIAEAEYEHDHHCCHHHDHDHHHEADGDHCGHHHDHGYDHDHHHEDGDHDHHCCHHDHDHDHGHDHHHHADDVFASWGQETTRRYSAEDLREILAALGQADEYGVVLRAKGIVRGDGENWLHFNYVPGESVVENGPADYTGRFCVIGSGLREAALKELFLGE